MNQPMNAPYADAVKNIHGQRDFRIAGSEVNELLFTLDGRTIPYRTGDSILMAARRVGVYIPSLCFHPELKAQGSCKLCTVDINGRWVSGCTTPVTTGLSVISESPALKKLRAELLELLFVEGNHFCPACEKSGDCHLQTMAYDHQLLMGHHAHFYPERRVDASHPDLLLDFNRCIFCELCVRTSAAVDGKHIFGIGGRGRSKYLTINSPTGLLKDADIGPDDAAANVCPVGVILHKRRGFSTPIGARTFDHQTPRTMTEQRIDFFPPLKNRSKSV